MKAVRLPLVWRVGTVFLHCFQHHASERKTVPAAPTSIMDEKSEVSVHEVGHSENDVTIEDAEDALCVVR